MEERIQSFQECAEDSLLVLHQSPDTAVETLREQGATDEEIKTVLTPLVQRLIQSKRRKRKVFMIVGACLLAVGFAMLALNLFVASKHIFGLTYTNMIYDFGVNGTFIIVGSVMLAKSSLFKHKAIALQEFIDTRL